MVSGEADCGCGADRCVQGGGRLSNEVVPRVLDATDATLRYGYTDLFGNGSVGKCESRSERKEHAGEGAAIIACQEQLSRRFSAVSRSCFFGPFTLHSTEYLREGKKSMDKLRDTLVSLPCLALAQVPVCFLPNAAPSARRN